MNVAVVTNLSTFLKMKSLDSPPDVSAWVLAAELALRTGDAGCISDLLCEPALPLPCAGRLAAHKKVRPGALGTYLSRPDLPADVLLGHVRGEQRPVVLLPVASTPDLSDVVYSQLAKSQAVSVQFRLLENPSVLPAVKLAVFERYVKQTDVPDEHDRHVRQVLRNELALHPSAFDAARPCWSPARLLSFFSRWSGLRPDQTVHLLVIAEDVLACGPVQWSSLRGVDKAVRCIAEHPGLSDSVLTRLEKVARLLPDPDGVTAEAVADALVVQSACQTVESLRAASHSELVDAIDAGTVRTEPQVLALAKNPVFDLGLARKLCFNLSSTRHDIQFATMDRIVAVVVASPADLLRVFISGLSAWSLEHWLAAEVTLRVFGDASPDELVEALTVARWRPEWRRFVELAAAAHCCAALTDEVIAHFGWANQESAYCIGKEAVQPLAALIRERVYLFLLNRLGTDPAVWSAFSSIVDGSVSLGDTADLAVLAAGCPEHQ